LFLIFNQVPGQPHRRIFALDTNTLFPIADWAFMHTTLIKMLEQGLSKGITAIGFILQHKERIMAIILAITLAKHQIGKHIAQVTMESFLIQLNELYTGLSSSGYSTDEGRSQICGNKHKALGPLAMVC
jgi:hypothetical protein